MIKKISQLDELPEIFKNKDNPEKSFRTLFEVSYLTADINSPARADEVNYYKSYQTSLSGVDHMLGLDEIRETIRDIIENGISAVRKDFEIGNPGSEETDRCGYKYYPGNTTVSSFSFFEQENDMLVHGKTNFNNNVCISCNDSDTEQSSRSILSVFGVASFANTINGVAYRAQWGDVAEIYDADAEYEPGTLVEFGGEKEITIAKNKANAVVTLKPGMLLNQENSQSMEHPVGIALVGKVPIRVRGPVRKFDNIVLSRIDPGTGIVYNHALPHDIVGKALETNLDENEKLVTCAVQMRVL